MIRLSDKRKLALILCTTAVGIAVTIPIGVGVLPIGLFAIPVVLLCITIGIAFLPVKDSIFH
jgi:hypothetical protein